MLIILIALLVLMMFGMLIGRTACLVLIGVFLLYLATHSAHADSFYDPRADHIAQAKRAASTPPPMHAADSSTDAQMILHCRTLYGTDQCPIKGAAPPPIAAPTPPPMDDAEFAYQRDKAIQNLMCNSPSITMTRAQRFERCP